MKFNIIFNKLAEVEVEVEDIQGAWRVAEQILRGEDDLDWTEADVQEIEKL
jgi:hypothetical protein